MAGGPLDADDFTLLVNGDPVTRSLAIELSTGVYTVSETAVATATGTYTTTFGGACNSAGIVSLGKGEHLTCTITNTYVPPPPGEDFLPRMFLPDIHAR